MAFTAILWLRGWNNDSNRWRKEKLRRCVNHPGTLRRRWCHPVGGICWAAPPSLRSDVGHPRRRYERLPPLYYLSCCFARRTAFNRLGDIPIPPRPLEAILGGNSLIAYVGLRKNISPPLWRWTAPLVPPPLSSFVSTGHTLTTYWNRIVLCVI